MNWHLHQATDRVATRYLIAGPLRDVSKLRFQAVFMMGAGASGKGWVGHKWMKYLPGGGMTGAGRDRMKELVQEEITRAERSLSNINFEKAIERFKRSTKFKLELDPSGLRMPFRLFDLAGKEIDPLEWEDRLPENIYREVLGIRDLVFSTPKYEIPSYWRQVNPDLYKEEVAGYVEDQPGYVHQMSSTMATSYFWSILETGDPLFVDGTGRNVDKMTAYIEGAKSAGYRTTVVLVVVPLIVNLIRNATRKRKVAARIIVDMRAAIQRSFGKIKSLADRFQAIDNRNDAADVKTYFQNKAAIDAQIRSTSKYDSLEDLIREVSPGDYRQWAPLLRWP